jgi:hypothetical protein
MVSDVVMDTTRLQEFLGAHYDKIIRFPIADAFADCFRQPEPRAQAVPAKI